MQRIKVLHMADMHLEWPFAGMGVDSHRGRMRREELKEVFAATVDLAIREQVELFLIAGDLFEHEHLTRATVRFLEQQFRRMDGIRVFISPGNHDPLLPNSYYRSYPWPSNVHIFGTTPERVDLPDRSVSVYGWGFGAWEVAEYQLGDLKVADPARVTIVVVHGGDEKYHPFTSAELAAIGADYIALGHIHKTDVVLADGDRVIARYAGSPEGLSFGEPGRHGVYVGSVGKDGNDLAFVPVGRREQITLEVDLTGAATPEEAQELIRACDTEERRLQHCYRVMLKGTPDADLAVDLPVWQEQLAGQFYLLRLVDQTRPDIDLVAVARERSARGLFVQRMSALEAEAQEPAERERIRRALQIGLVAFQERGSGR